MKKENPSSEDIQNTLDSLEKETEKNLEESKKKLLWAQSNLNVENGYLVSCESEVNRARMRMQIIKDLKRKNY